MADPMNDLDVRLDAALRAMREPADVRQGVAARMAARAVLANAPLERASTWSFRAAAALALVALGASAMTMMRQPGSESHSGETPIALSSSSRRATDVAFLPVASRGARPIVFEFDAPDAQRVQVLGDFNQWTQNGTDLQRSPDGRWRTTSLLPPGRYVYAFLVDGKRFERDPARDPVEDRDFGVPGSELVVGEAP
jgi:Glycogen recognition site of AMP-activated protein kinase